MKRTEFLETIRGHESAHFRRKMKVMYLSIDQEPQTKTISIEDARHFRNIVSNQMKRANRRAFKADVVMEIGFFSTSEVPLPVQTLVKNYLDLLHKEMPEADKYRQLAFVDDSQIKLLMANHYTDSHKAKIYIKLYRFSYFLKDAEYAQNILRNEFSDKNYNLNDDFQIDERRRLHNEPSLSELIRDFNELKSSQPNQHVILPLVHENIIRMQIFDAYVKQNDFRLERLLEYFQTLFRQNRPYSEDERFQSLFRITRDYMFIGLDFIPMGGAPVRSGESKIFRGHLRTQLKQFVQQHEYLFPLLSPVGLTIICIPPAYNAPDADNLARQIVSSFDEICRPPLTHTSLPGVSTHRTKKIRFSTPSYQIIYLPRNDGDPADGKIMVLLNKGYLNGNGLWTKISNLIDKWEDHTRFRLF